MHHYQSVAGNFTHSNAAVALNRYNMGNSHNNCHLTERTHLPYTRYKQSEKSLAT